MLLQQFCSAALCVAASSNITYVDRLVYGLIATTMAAVVATKLTSQLHTALTEANRAVKRAISSGERELAEAQARREAEEANQANEIPTENVDPAR